MYESWLSQYYYLRVCDFVFVSGKGAISGKAAEVVYEDPDSLQVQEYRPKNDGDIELKEYPAYEKPSEQPDIELVDCPAYVEKKKDQNIKLEECPAYGHLASDPYYD